MLQDFFGVLLGSVKCCKGSAGFCESCCRGHEKQLQGFREAAEVAMRNCCKSLEEKLMQEFEKVVKGVLRSCCKVFERSL